LTLLDFNHHGDEYEKGEKKEEKVIKSWGRKKRGHKTTTF